MRAPFSSEGPLPPAPSPQAGRGSPGPRAGRGLRWAALTVVGAGLVLGVALAVRFGTDPAIVASPLIGREAPDLTLPRLEQEGELSLAELRGRVVVVNFWASWCLECRLEHPELVATAAAYEQADVRFVGVVFNDRLGPALDFLEELGGGYPNVADPGSRAAIEFGVFGVPETFFIDPTGRIVAKITGPSSRELLSSTIDRILLGQQPGARTTGTVQTDPGD